MTPRIRLFYDLRAKGFDFFDALRISEVDWPMGMTFVVCLVLLLGMVGFIESLFDAHAEAHAMAETKRANTEQRRADFNLKAFNHAMQGGSFLLEDRRALFTCPALESRI